MKPNGVSGQDRESYAAEAGGNPQGQGDDMKKNGHTPGPWKVTPYLTPGRDDDPMGVYQVSPAHEILTGQYFGTDSEDEAGEEIALAAIHAENQANADFIALACNSYEDLLAALEMAIVALKDHNLDAGEFEILEDAIAQARGQV